jgi:hypothetical protein
MKRSAIWAAAGALALVAASSIATIAVLTQDGPPPASAHAALASQRLGGAREYHVHLPASYAREPQRRYPVAYVLDAGPQFAAMIDASALLARLERVPELIVVGIPSPDDAARQRDFTPPGMRIDVEDAESKPGQADSFLGFLAEELIPEVERRYRTTNTRILSGHSRGGLFVIYSLLAAPELFAARFAHSPALWRDGHAMVRRLAAELPQLRGETSLFLSLGDGENERMRAGYDDALQVLTAAAPATLRWSSTLSTGADHGSNAQLATPLALHRFFVEADAGVTTSACRPAPSNVANTLGTVPKPVLEVLVADPHNDNDR